MGGETSIVRDVEARNPAEQTEYACYSRIFSRMEFILDWISQYGYVAIFGLLMLGIVGLPIPDETLLVFCGYLISKGRLHPAATVVTAFLGSAAGITCSYIIGRTLGLGFVHKYGSYVHLTQGRIDRVHAWFDRIGHWALFVGYYIAGVRHFTAIVAGTSCLELRSFAAYAYTGAFVWVCSFLGLGYFFGEHWREASEIIERNLLIVSAVVVFIAVGYIVYRRRKRLKS
jgi:membrane protein DedA with SNARE-associated domain